MSFLYQALIKEQQKEQRGNKQDADENVMPVVQADTQANFYAHHGQPPFPPQNNFVASASFVPERSNNHHWFWLTIAALLMVVGLLGGYLFGTKDTVQNLYTDVAEGIIQTEQKQVADSLEQQHVVANSSPEQGLDSNVSAVNLEPEQVEKQIEVAVGQDGQVKTQVTDLSSEQPAQEVSEETEEQPLVRNSVPEVSLDEIPDALKSSFENAVKATEEKTEPNLFQTQVASGSSLPLVSELPLSEIYWVPDIEYQMHIYASDASERWIRVNGKTLNEGDPLIDNLILLEIRQEQVIWQTDNRRFAQNALEDFVKQ